MSEAERQQINQLKSMAIAAGNLTDMGGGMGGGLGGGMGGGMGMVGPTGMAPLTAPSGSRLSSSASFANGSGSLGVLRPPHSSGGLPPGAGVVPSRSSGALQPLGGRQRVR